MPERHLPCTSGGCPQSSSGHLSSVLKTFEVSFVWWHQHTPVNQSILTHAPFWHRQHNLCWSVTRRMRRLQGGGSWALVTAFANSNNSSGSWVCESRIPADINRAGDTTPLGLAPQKSLQRWDFERCTFSSASLAFIQGGVVKGVGWGGDVGGHIWFHSAVSVGVDRPHRKSCSHYSTQLEVNFKSLRGASRKTTDPADQKWISLDLLGRFLQLV